MFNAMPGTKIQSAVEQIQEEIAYRTNKENLIFNILLNEHLVIPDSSMIFFDSMRRILRENPIILKENIIYPLIRKSANNFRDIEEIGEQNKIGDRPTDPKRTAEYNDDYGNWLDKQILSSVFLNGDDMEETFTKYVIDISKNKKFDIKKISRLLEKTRENYGKIGLTPIYNQLRNSKFSKEEMRIIDSILRTAYTITPSGTINEKYFEKNSLIRLNLPQDQFVDVTKQYGSRLVNDYTKIIKNRDFKVEYKIDTSIFANGYLQDNFSIGFIIDELRDSKPAKNILKLSTRKMHQEKTNSKNYFSILSTLTRLHMQKKTIRITVLRNIKK